MVIIDGNPVEIKADAGMVLTNGDIYSTWVILGKHDSVLNWREMPESDVPQEEEIDEETDYAEAGRILLGSLSE